jgi:WD40 repeat protein/tRNA A-37 threonylcarbamoyl transferase component Bud32
VADHPDDKRDAVPQPAPIENTLRGHARTEEAVAETMAPAEALVHATTQLGTEPAKPKHPTVPPTLLASDANKPKHPTVPPTLPAPTVASMQPAATGSMRARPASQSGTSGSSGSSGTNRSTVGNEMKGASIERFDTVDHSRFELLDELARGGLGRVFRARDPRTGRIVAIKEVLKPQHEIILRFAREALVTANLQHPSIVPVYEVGRWPNGDPYYAMKLVEGRTLDQMIKTATTLEARMALLPHVVAVAEALAYAHSEHVIHRDLKPANILVGSYGETVVIDWGLAKNLATGEEIEALPAATTIPPDSVETMAGAVVGTPAYMPPEQALGEKIDERADVYAIGAILYHVLAGQRPFIEAKHLDELLEMVSQRSPKKIAELAPDVPPELVAIAERAMARDPAARYPTALGLAEDLRKFSSGKLVGAHRYTNRELIRRWIAQHRATVATAFVAFALLIVVGTIGVVRIAHERDEANRQRAVAQHERGEAQDARTLAEQRFGASLEELARQELLAGESGRALTLAAGALAATPSPSPSLIVIAHEARSAFAGLAGIAPPMALAAQTSSLSPDARRVYTTTSDDTMRAWDLAANKAVWEAKRAFIADLSPDGTRLAGASIAGMLVVIDAATGAQQAAWPVPTTKDSLPSTVTWSHDNTHFAATNYKGAIWLATTGQTAPPLSLPGFSAALSAVEFSPAGTHLMGCEKATGRVIVFDGATGAQTASYDGLEGGCWGLGWLDEDRALLGDDKAGHIWNVKTKQIERSLPHGTWIYGFAHGGPPDHEWIATYGDGTTVTIWDAATGQKRFDLSGHAIGIDRAAVLEPWLITTDETSHTYVWDPATGERVQAIPVEGFVNHLAVAGPYLGVFGDTRQRVWRLDPEDTMQHLRGHTARVRDLVFADPHTLWTASNDGTARRFDLSGGEPLVLGAADFTEPTFATADDPAAKGPPNPHGLRSLSLSPDGSTLVTASEDGMIRLWDAAKGVVRATWEGHTGRVRRVVFTKDRKVAFSVGDTTLRRWDTATGTLSVKRDLGSTGWEVALFPDDDVVATTADDKSFRLWRAADLAELPCQYSRDILSQLPFVGDRVVTAAAGEVFLLDKTCHLAGEGTHSTIFSATTSVSPAGSFIATGDTLGRIIIHDGKTAAPVRELASGLALVIALAYNPAGTLLASSNGREVQLWDPATGALLARSRQLPAVITKVVWSPDGTRLAMSGGSGTIWVWKVVAAPTDLAAFAACASPWRLDGATLVRATIAPAACGTLPLAAGTPATAH